jgi:hypothetical protein
VSKRRERFRFRGLALSAIAFATLATVSCGSGCPGWTSRSQQFGPLVEGGWQTPLPEHTAEFGGHADPATYTGSLLVNIDRQCSATLIGPKAVLSAAHCNTDAGDLDFKLNGKTYTGHCTRYPYYHSTNHTGDWSLCRVDEDVANVTYETLSLDPNLIKVGSRVILTGFGGAMFSFSMGAATVESLPSGASDDIITRGATILDGDSGSAAFVVTPTNGRRVVAVNSRTINIPTKTSALSSLSTGRAKTFIDEWLKMPKNADVQICGYGPNTIANCQP